ncbi:MAG TPA: 4Fe-4S ferredoxin, partial [Dehalococcoidia bacterium]|nr:4Fe-4S ferredoxin [Dehalococcoidia bacterium]
MEQELRKEARKLLEEGEVDYIVGFAPGSLKFSTTPLITKEKEEVASLVINPFIVNNLAKFLTEVLGRVGIVAKGCDSRSIVSLIQDNQIARENVVIIGVPCSGLIDIVKVEKLVGKDRDEIGDIALQGEKVAVIVGGEKTELP